MSTGRGVNEDESGDMEGLLAAALALAWSIHREKGSPWGAPTSGLIAVLEHAIKAYECLPPPPETIAQ